MQQETLRVRKRDVSGTRPARRMRREGLVPAVVYGRGLETTSLTVGSRDLYAVLHTEAGLNALIELEVDEGQTVLTVAREIQRDAIRGDLTHVDFIKVSLDVEIEAEVLLDFVGTPIGVREDEGFVETIEATVLISALPTQIPTSIEANIEDLGIGDTLRVADLPAVEGVTYLVDADRPLASVILPSVIEEEEEEIPDELLEGEELPEGEEGAPADAAPEETTEA